MDAGASFRKHEREKSDVGGTAHKSVDANVVAARSGGAGGGSEVASLAPSSSSFSTETVTIRGQEDLDRRDEKDRERWVKLKRLKQAFHVTRKGRGKGKEKGKSGSVEAG